MTVHVNIQEKCLFKTHTRDMMYAQNIGSNNIHSTNE